jgi:predicted Zn-dependent protease
MALDPRDPYAHYAFAIVSAFAGSASAAARTAQTAIDLNPSFTLGHLVLGMAKLFDGDPQRAIAPLAHGLLLNPNDPQNLAWYNLLAYAQLLAGEPAHALESANRALTVRPIFRPTFEVLACCAVALGRIEEARGWAARMKELDGPASHFIAPLRRNYPDCDAQIARMLNMAGA